LGKRSGPGACYLDSSGFSTDIQHTYASKTYSPVSPAGLEQARK